MKLHHHPSTPSAIPTPWVRLGRRNSGLLLTFRITGDTSGIDFPRRLGPFIKNSEQRRGDRLWERTCFEAFVRPADGKGYLELNFSPSSEWAAYQFDDYRVGMRDAPLPAPAVIPTDWRNRFELSASVDLMEWGACSWHLNLSAVIEEKSGAKSFWALAHPPEGPPDFHHPSCFVLELPPPSAP